MVSILDQVKMNLLAGIRAGHHYWFAMGLVFAFCIHQIQLNITEMSLVDEIGDQIGHIPPPQGAIASGNTHSSTLGSNGGGLRSKNSISCDWFPDNTQDCDEMLRERLPLGNPFLASDDFIRKRWLFFGDSTMKRLFAHSPLRTQLVAEPFNSLAKKKPHECWQKDEKMGLICQQRYAERCKLNDLFDLPYAPQWTKPEPSRFEGPIRYGATNEYCTDCSGCESNFLDCQIKDMGLASYHPNLRPCTSKRITYGGYISIEFARDVEVQSPKYKTTQENIAHYLHTSWNLPGSPLVQQWGLPICVINTSAHDSMLENVTVEAFIKNVNWYLNLFVNECSHFIWLSNTAPANDGMNFPQTEKSMRDYNEAVKKLLTHSRVLSKMSSYINIFDASLNSPHADHIHMDNAFYHQFGKWMVDTFMK